MSRTAAFEHNPRKEQLPRNLRNNAREAAEYLTGLKPDVPDSSHTITRQKYGKSSGSNN